MSLYLYRCEVQCVKACNLSGRVCVSEPLLCFALSISPTVPRARFTRCVVFPSVPASPTACGHALGPCLCLLTGRVSSGGWFTKSCRKTETGKSRYKLNKHCTLHKGNLWWLLFFSLKRFLHTQTVVAPAGCTVSKTIKLNTTDNSHAPS